MADREKVIKGLQNLRDAIATDFIHEVDQAVGTIDDAIELLKEQDKLLRRIRKNRDKLCEEYSNLKHRFHEKTELVRCKDCKHGKQLFADYVSCQISEENESGCHASHRTDWFCADGELKTAVEEDDGTGI